MSQREIISYLRENGGEALKQDIMEDLGRKCIDYSLKSLKKHGEVDVETVGPFGYRRAIVRLVGDLV